MPRLTDQGIKALPAPAQGVKVYPDDTMPGFGIRCSQGGGKSYVLTFGADRRRVTIGRVGLIGLSEARTAAKRLLAEHTLGKHRAPRISLSDALQGFLEAKELTNRSRTMKDTRRILHKHLEPLKTKNLEDISTHDLTRMTDKLAKTVPGTARHVFCECRAFFRWCVKRRYIPHSPLEGLDPPTPARSRERVLSDDELRTVWRAADETGYPFGAIVKLLILTGQRRGEIANLRADWLSENSCTIPKEITKNKRAHTFPIGQMTQNLLAKIHSGTSSSALMFAARGQGDAKPFNGWSKSKAALDAKAKIEPWVLHDIRRSYATTLQRLGVRTEVIEALLNHVSGTKAGIVGVYQKHRWEAEMREAVNLYDDATLLAKYAGLQPDPLRADNAYQRFIDDATRRD